MADVFPGGVPVRPPGPGGPRRGVREAAVFLGLIVVGLLVAGVATVVDRTASGDSSSAPGTSVAGTATSVSTSVATTVTSAVPPTMPPTTLTSTTASGPTTTARPGTTTAPASATTTAAPTTTRPPTTTSTTPPPSTTSPDTLFPECRPADLTVSVAADQLAFTTAEPVRATATVRHTGGIPCFLAEASFVWRTDAGQAVCCAVVITDCFGRCAPNFSPGQVAQITACWDQRALGGGQVGPGGYTVGYREALSPFRINAAPAGSSAPSC